MESIKMLGGKEFCVNGVDFTLSLTPRVIFTMFVCNWLKGDLPVRLSQKEIADALGVEYKTIGRSLKGLIQSGMLLAKKTKGENGSGYMGWSYYGHKEITVDGFTIPEKSVEYPDDEDHIVQISPLKEFYVYVCTHNHIPVYVGKGIGSRMDHCLSGKSTSFGLNKLIVEGERHNMKVAKMYSGLTSDEALDKEREIIEGFKLLGYDLTNLQ